VTKEQKIIGSWEDLQASAAGAISHDRMLLTSTQLAGYWRRCSLSSDFWARYIALSSPHFQVDRKVKREAVESTLSYLLNEMFENCAKFSAGPVNAVTYEAWLFPDRLAIQMTNHIAPDQMPEFVKLIDQLLSGDPNELYFQRLEENAETNQTGSGLGYLTLMKDYNVRFGFRFVPAGEGSVAVDVQAHINVKEI
jgi:hypothetical protein